MSHTHFVQGETAAIVAKCIRCGCTADGQEKFGGHVCEACDQMDGDITGETNRVDLMPDVTITGFWKGDGEEGVYSCKIGNYMDDPSDDEAVSDESIFFYFESEDSIKHGTGDFVVTSYTLDSKVVTLSQDQIDQQIENDPVGHFFARFVPIENTSNTACFENGDKKFGFETFGADLERVTAMDPHHIWTVVDSEIHDGTVIVNGMRLCNRVFYILTEKPWKDGELLSIRCS